MFVLHYREESVSAAMEEVKPHDWMDQVYNPEIKVKWEALCKKPGCDSV